MQMLETAGASALRNLICIANASLTISFHFVKWLTINITQAVLIDGVAWAVRLFAKKSVEKTRDILLSLCLGKQPWTMLIDVNWFGSPGTSQ